MRVRQATAASGSKTKATQRIPLGLIITTLLTSLVFFLGGMFALDRATCQLELEEKQDAGQSMSEEERQQMKQLNDGIIP